MGWLVVIATQCKQAHERCKVNNKGGELAQGWYVYVLKCADETLYTGICTNVERRLQEHNESSKGARYTRSRRPVSVLYTESHESRAAASRREAQIKKMPRAKKLILVGK